MLRSKLSQIVRMEIKAFTQSLWARTAAEEGRVRAAGSRAAPPQRHLPAALPYHNPQLPPSSAFTFVGKGNPFLSRLYLLSLLCHVHCTDSCQAAAVWGFPADEQ